MVSLYFAEFHNRIIILQGVCYKLALEKGIAHAQLPLKNYIKLQTRKILTVVHGME